MFTAVLHNHTHAQNARQVEHGLLRELGGEGCVQPVGTVVLEAGDGTATSPWSLTVSSGEVIVSQKTRPA